MSEHDFEPIRGLPGRLPPGEKLLWQGAPDWWTMATRVFHVRVIGTYFAALIVWRVLESLANGLALGAIALGVSGIVAVAALGVGILAGLSWLICRTTVYTITSKRVVMRFGVALTKAINIPHTIIDGAAMKPIGKRGAGDIALDLVKPNKIAFLQLWPHARPDRLSNPQPTFRGVAKAQEAAACLARALLAHREAAASVPHSITQEKVAPSTTRPPSPELRPQASHA